MAIHKSKINFSDFIILDGYQNYVQPDHYQKIDIWLELREFDVQNNFSRNFKWDQLGIAQLEFKSKLKHARISHSLPIC